MDIINAKSSTTGNISNFFQAKEQVVIQVPEQLVEQTKKPVIEHVAEKPTEKPTEKLSKNQHKIIDLIEQNPKVTGEKISKLIGIRADTVRDNISVLKTKGLLERIGPDKGGYWKIIGK